MIEINRMRIVLCHYKYKDNKPDYQINTVNNVVKFARDIHVMSKM